MGEAAFGEIKATVAGHSERLTIVETDLKTFVAATNERWTGIYRMGMGMMAGLALNLFGIVIGVVLLWKRSP